MPEIKNQFTGGKMNKDLDERLVPKGEYRDAMNIQVSTSEGSDVGAVQNILGNTPGCTYNPTSTNPLVQNNPIQPGSYTVGSISDEKNDSLYWLIAGSEENLDMSTFQPITLDNGAIIPNTASFKDMIMRTNSDVSIAPSGCEPVFVDKYKWCSTIDPAILSTLTDTIVFDDTSLYANITAGMQATGYAGGNLAWGPRLVTSVGSLQTISVNYQSNSQTQVILPGSTSVVMNLRTFDDFVPGYNVPGFGWVPGAPNKDFYNPNYTNPSGNSTSTNNVLPSDYAPDPAAKWEMIQLWMDGITAMPSVLAVGSSVSTPFGWDGVITKIVTVSLFDSYYYDANTGSWAGQNPTPIHLITIGIPAGNVADPAMAISGGALSVNSGGVNSQLNYYDPFLVNIITPGGTAVVPDDTMCIPAASQQWLNEIYQIMFEPGTTYAGTIVDPPTPTGNLVYIDNSVGAGSLWPPNSCIDPQSFIDPLGNPGFALNDGVAIEYNTCFSIMNCSTGVSVNAIDFNTNSLPLTFFRPGYAGVGLGIDAIYLDESVDMQNVDAVCFESDRVLNFDSSRLITGINIIDDMLFWTDNFSEPKKINIPRSIEGTDPIGDTHTAVINSATGLSLSNYHPIREEHITVIKKAPKSALAMDLKTSRDPNKNYSGVVTISDDTTLMSGLWQQRGAPGPAPNAAYPYDFSTFTTEEGSNIMYIAIFADLDGNTSFQLDDWKIGSKVVLKEYTNNQPPQIPIQDYTIKGQVTAWDYTNSNGVTVDANTFNSTIPTPTAYANWPTTPYCKVAIKITSISRPPQTAVSGFLNYAIDLYDESEKLYEFKLPRFSYRYKYEDGEYSTFAPWTSVAFIPGSFDYHAKKGYNLGMTNSVSRLELKDYITPEMPLDVVEIDLLYKEDSSPNVYVVETIRPDSEATIPGFGGLRFNHWALNSFEIDKENIKNILPANQLLRPWDNVPKKALAQEVTGSRVVYGNYEQNYDLVANGLKFNPSIQVGVVDDTSSVKSIKSLREYQLGVVFTDKYGRETPVISNNSGTFKIEKGGGIKKNKLKIRLQNAEAPFGMEYFKFYIKETSGEYYNMAMDRYYDAEDGNVWVSFASADRNKIDIDTFLILKKGVDSNELVEDPARFKVIAIENEAPDFIKIKKAIISDRKHVAPTTPPASTNDNIFDNSNLAFLPTVGDKDFSIQWDGAPASSGDPVYSNTSIKNLHEQSSSDGDIYFQIVSDDGNRSSIPMKIVKIELSDDPTTAPGAVYWNITLEEPFGIDILKFTDSPSDQDNVTKILDGNRAVFWNYKKENSAEFDGRFFVKIFEEDVFTEHIVNNPTVTSISQSFISAGVSQKIYSFDTTKHNKIWSPILVAGVGGIHFANYPGGTGDFTVTSWNDSTPDIGHYFRVTNNTGSAYGNSGTDWQVHSAFFRGSNLHKMESSPVDSTFYQAHAINWRASSETMELHNPLASDELEFEDVWFVDGEDSAGRFNGNWGGNLSNTPYVPTGYDLSGGNIGVIDLGFGGIQPSRVKDSSGNLLFSPWKVNDWLSPSAASLADDPSFYDLSANMHYSNTANDFAEFLKPTQIWAWREDPTKTIYNFTSQSFQNLVRHENINSSAGIYSQYINAFGDNPVNPLIGSADYNSNWYAQSTLFRPDNYSKNYQLTFQNYLDSTKLIEWNPYTFGAIDKGLVLPLKVASIVSTGAGGVPREITVDSLTVNDVSGENYGTLSVSKGMTWDVTDTTTRGSFTPSWVADTNTNRGAVISEINVGSKTLRFKQYHPNFPSDEFPVLAVDDIIYIKQFGMNGISRNSAKNINKFWDGTGFSDINPGVEAVGYTMEMKDISSNSTESEFPRFPAIFETEPKEESDLDIYYEISGDIPTKLNMSNIESILPVGADLELRSQDFSVGNLNTGVIPAGSGLSIISNTWNGTGQDIVLNTSPIAGVGSGDKLIVHRSDGSKIEVEILSAGNTGTSPLQATLQLNPNLLQQNVTSSWYNCYSFGNGVESNRIRDNFNLPFIAHGVKVSTTLDYNYKKEHRKHGLIYSGIYNSNSGINNLNQFIQAEKITKDINPIYGSIQKLHSGWGQSGDLVALCEDRVLRILANKDALFNADGSANVTATDKVLGTATPYSGEFGISENPESFASEAYRAYFTDKVRGTVMRLSMDGLTPISDHGMKDWFRDNLKLSNRLIGSYDDKKDEYNITLDQPDIMTQTGGSTMQIANNSTTVSFKENVKGWVSFKSFIPEHANSCANEYYTFVDGDLWKHHIEVIDPITQLETHRNTFYGNFTPSSLNVILNEIPGSIKTFHTLNYEGTQSKIDEFREYDTFEPGTTIVRDSYSFIDPIDPNFSNQQIGYYNLKDIPGWYVNSITTDLEEGGVPEFIKKEGKWFNYIRGKTGSIIDHTSMTSNIQSGYNNANFAFQGIATASSVSIGGILGCMDPTMLNYNPLATSPDPSAPCIPSVSGCTDPNASSGYDPLANVDDGSCQYYGCMDPLALNYDPNATQDPSNVCIYCVYGCMDPTALNYNSSATCDDGSCAGCVYGCMDPTASNYDANATCDDGSCTYPVSGCTDPAACNYDPAATIDDGSCNYGGCMDAMACNYDASAICDDGSCLYCNDSSSNVMNFDNGTCNTGCIYCEMPILVSSSVTPTSITLNITPAPVNANTAVTIEYMYFLFPSSASTSPYPAGGGILQSVTTTNTTKTFGGLDPNTHYSVSIIAICQNNPTSVTSGSLYTGFVTSAAVISGCTDPNASNYDPTATVDDGSCLYNAGCTDPTALNYDPAAMVDDGSCTYCVYGCMIGSSNMGSQINSNYDSSATCACNSTDLAQGGVGPLDPSQDNDCCTACVYGCTDSTASNYDSTATCDDGSCVPFTFGCMHPSAMNYNASATADDDSCMFNGCTNPNATNYSFGDNTLGNTVTQTNDPYLPPGGPSNVTSGFAFDDGSCTYPTPGCTDTTATNYDPNAGVACNSNDPAQGGPGDPSFTSGYDPQFDNECCLCPCTDCCVDSINFEKTLPNSSTVPAYMGPNDPASFLGGNLGGNPLPAGDVIRINMSGTCAGGGTNTALFSTSTTAGCQNAANVPLNGYGFEITGPSGIVVFAMNSVGGGSSNIGIDTVDIQLMYTAQQLGTGIPTGGDGVYTVTFYNESMNCMSTNTGPAYCTSNSSSTFTLLAGCMIPAHPAYNPAANIPDSTMCTI